MIERMSIAQMFDTGLGCSRSSELPPLNLESQAERARILIVQRRNYPLPLSEARVLCCVARIRFLIFCGSLCRFCQYRLWRS